MRKQAGFPNFKPTAIDGERLARAARSKAQFSQTVWWYRGHGFSDSDILRALADAKTVIPPLCFRGGSR